jgi:hypothetical protein
MNENYDTFPILKLLVEWMDVFASLQKYKQIKIFQSVFGKDLQRNGLNNYESVIIYLNYISQDLLQLIKR